MASVTQRIKEIQQPHGGYLPIKFFSKTVLSDGKTLNEVENIHASLVGLAVDYLTRFMMGTPAIQAFNISLMGATNIKKDDIALYLIENIRGLDDTSINCACKLVGFDVCYRSSATGYKPVENIVPDTPTIENIRTMVKRSMVFFGQYGPIVKSEVSFEGGYTPTVNVGDGDFITHDTLWDFKVSKSAPTSKHSLQLLMYYIMGKHSIHKEFQSITQLGIFNPRLNIVYTYPTSAISAELYDEISTNVIRYGLPVLVQEQTNTEAAHSASNSEYTVAEVSKALSVSTSAIYTAIKSGHLQAYKKHGKYVITEEALAEYSRYIRLKKTLSAIIPIAFVILILILFFYFLDL